ncbi:phosphatidylinositol-specific phospholipase C/glycerophosphodiester phosphodiesterase family protein [Pedobacter agri]|uniref:phosphatidylinositol-specific phospholipase C/glycerophosphodiester phosphodiesterase family protein n=1 Tax=Pedobacter agri TaxID=454586 RepID=UPI00292D191B|nr:phosphatidylinositol-specific phospholipase C/glycerophosphodiester phosphodiesterase family protein [Pedobacter agri]
MAKQIIVFLSLLITTFGSNAQVKIHSHNDYTHSKPFYDAVANNAFSIEADVFVVGDALIVAHSKKEIKAENTLENLYLKPIASFSQTTEFYSFQLMIDFKDSWEMTYPILEKSLKPFQRYLSRGNKKINIVISGNRPADSTFHTFNAISFDGLPGVNYRSADLKKITMISDNFAKYSKWKGVGEIPEADKARLKALIDHAHEIGKPFRFWGAPDHQACWKLLHDLGADIINTDQVAKASNYFNTKLQ